jgi:hypothetical protein
MRKSLVLTALAAAAFAAVPSSATLVGVGSLAAAVSLFAHSEASAMTAVLPGWRHPCGRNPRCLERVEGRRLDRLRANAARSGSAPAP